MLPPKNSHTEESNIPKVTEREARLISESNELKAQQKTEESTFSNHEKSFMERWKTNRFWVVRAIFYIVNSVWFIVIGIGSIIAWIVAMLFI